MSSFTITTSGECQFSSDDKKQLSPASRIGFWGCWLAFEDNVLSGSGMQKKSLINKLLPTSSTNFLLKNSMPPNQYARLCRVILKLSNKT